MRKNKKIIMAGITAIVAAGILAGSVEYASHTFPLSITADAKAGKKVKENETIVQEYGKTKEQVEKQESVYTTLDASGEVKNVIVSDWLKNAGIGASINDVSTLEDIVNTKGEETYAKKGDSLIWEAGNEDIYYQGTTRQELPVGVNIKYFMDGVEQKPEELAGKSGKLTIELTYTNHTKNQVVIHGNEEEIVTPFLMATGMVLPVENFKNIRIDNGEVLSEGKNDIVVAYGLPGLAESLKLSEISLGEGNDLSELEEKLTDSVTITADVKDFEMGQTYTVATSKVFKKVDVKEEKGIDALNDSLDELKQAAKELVNGTKTIESGLTTLDSKFAEYEKGVKTLSDSTKILKEGADTLENGVEKYTEGTQTLLKGVSDYTNGTKEFAKGVKNYTGNTKKLADALGELGAGTEQLSAGTEEFGANLETYVATVNKWIKAMEAQGGDAQTLEQLRAAGKALVAACDTQLEGGAKKVEESVTRLHTSAEALTTNNQVLEGSADVLQKNAGTINENAKKITTSGKELRSGAQKLAEGTKELLSGTQRLYDKTTDVSDALGMLSDGGAKLESGMIQFERDGIWKLTNRLEQLTQSADLMLDRYEALAEAAKSYRSFSGLDSRMEGNVKFIFTTEEISTKE